MQSVVSKPSSRNRAASREWFEQTGDSALKTTILFFQKGAPVKVPMLVALLVVALLTGLAFIFLVM